ncbi:hypothetical protein L596_022011 [Steinernema carpocapsae]|uniref:Uncharacterized protein n=1 Tax=Steinernema carpocapsae TaxID=34508 RepID=A0A4U5MLA6_STECR|nr:hypothetical protein L596_022011 [Steinernema carpocapsae]
MKSENPRPVESKDDPKMMLFRHARNHFHTSEVSDRSMGRSKEARNKAFPDKLKPPTENDPKMDFSRRALMQIRPFDV